MPIDTTDVVAARARVSVCLEPVYNQLYSLILAVKDERMPGVQDWVVRTREQMSLEERQRHRLVMLGLFYAFSTEAKLESFGAYIDHLAALPAVSFQDRLMSTYTSITPQGCAFMPEVRVDRALWARALATTDSYLEFLGAHFDTAILDPDLEAQAYRYVVDPPAMKKLIVDHLRVVWDRYLTAEWSRVRPLVRDSVDAFRGVDLTSLPRRDAVRHVIGRDLPNQHWERLVEEAGEIVLVPNAHVGPYLGKLINGATLVVIFGARQPRDAAADAPDLSRSEILANLTALADDNRLRILRMALEAAEIRAPDVMAGLDMSQSAASRHLSQLTATGFLTERWRDGGKAYTLNTARAGDTVRAIARYLRVPVAALGGGESNA